MGLIVADKTGKNELTVMARIYPEHTGEAAAWINGYLGSLCEQVRLTLEGPGAKPTAL